jgi:hypothetical protein
VGEAAERKPYESGPSPRIANTEDWWGHVMTIVRMHYVTYRRPD